MSLQERCLKRANLEFSCHGKDFRSQLYQVKKDGTFAEYHIFDKGDILLRAIITVFETNNNLEFHIPYCEYIIEDEILSCFAKAFNESS